MIKNLESADPKLSKPSSISEARVLGIRSYSSGRDYKEDKRDKVEYACDAVCLNCHCATFV